jgi:hypothetical protein
MEKNCRLEKEYTIPFELYRDAYDEYLKKNIYPKSRIFMLIFLVVAVVYIAAAIEDPSSTFAYILIFLCLAFAFREWYNPRKMRRSIIDTVRDMGEIRYKLLIENDSVEFSTINSGDVENFPEEDDDSENIPGEPTVIPVEQITSIQEYERFFLLYHGKEMFYIIPKDVFSQEELEIVRTTVAGSQNGGK